MPNIGIARLQVTQKQDRSVVTQQYGKAPLQVHRPLYLDESGQPTVYLKTPSAGLLAGDEHEIAVHVEKSASLKLCTQACTLVYPGTSKQTVDICIEDGGTLIFQPHALILATNADFSQTINITLGENCNLLLSDYWCAGRIAMKEQWQFKCFRNTITMRAAGKLIYREHWSLDPQGAAVKHPVLCNDYTHFQNTYSCGTLKQNSTDINEPSMRLWNLNKDGYNIRRVVSKSVVI